MLVLVVVGLFASQNYFLKKLSIRIHISCQHASLPLPRLVQMIVAPHICVGNTNGDSTWQDRWSACWVFADLVVLVGDGGVDEIDGGQWGRTPFLNILEQWAHYQPWRDVFQKMPNYISPGFHQRWTFTLYLVSKVWASYWVIGLSC